jgi:hypothetical protein
LFLPNGTVWAAAVPADRTNPRAITAILLIESLQC